MGRNTHEAGKGGKLWEDRYHDRILFHHGQLDALINYIKDNPQRLALKRANKDLFHICQAAQIENIHCTTLGNIFLADYPYKQVLQCSRKLTQEQIDSLKEECLNKAVNGTIFISAAISEGEKQLCRTIRQAGLPIIILLEKVFPSPDDPHYEYYKAQGVYFEACAAGNLLLVEPDKSLFERTDIMEKVYQKAGEILHESLRYRFLALNMIAELMLKS